MTYGKPAPSFAESSDGLLFIARGDQPVKRWDGFASSVVSAGVPAPEAQPAIAASGTGAITGRLFAYVRFLDNDGRVSNMSPISEALVIGGSSGNILAATFESPIKITSIAHGLSTGNSVVIEGVLGNYAANGTHVITRQDGNSFTLNGTAATGEYVSGGTWKSGASTITYSNVEVPTDPRVITRQMLRNKDGNASVFYIDLEDTTLSGTTFNSTNTDVDLGASVEVPLRDSNGNDLALTRHAEPPNYKRVIVSHYGRMFMGVDYVYRRGAVAVTNLSTTVTGIGTAWTSSMEGRTFFITGTNNTQTYTVSSVNTGAQTLTLSEAYAGNTSPFEHYAIAPAESERLKVYYSAAGLPDSFDFLNHVVELNEDPAAGEMTALAPLQDRLYILFENHAYRLTYSVDPNNDGEVYLSTRRGCVNQRCWVTVNNVAFLMDRKGVWVMGGDEETDISGPINPIFEGDGEFAISWRQREYFHAAHFPAEEIIRWFVTLGGSGYPRHALCLHYMSRRWWIEEYAIPIPSSALGEMDGRQRVFLGTQSRTVVSTQGMLDGVHLGENRSTGTSGTPVALVDSAADFTQPSPGVVPVHICEGTGKGQTRLIAAATDKKLTVLHPWTTQPDGTSVYQIGGFRWRWQSGMFRWREDGYATEETRGVEILFRPESVASTVLYRKYLDELREAVEEAMTRDENGTTSEADSPDVHLDFMLARGFIQHIFDSYRSVKVDGNRHVRIELEGVPNKKRHRVRELNVLGARRGAGFSETEDE